MDRIPDKISSGSQLPLGGQKPLSLKDSGNEPAIKDSVNLQGNNSMKVSFPGKKEMNELFTGKEKDKASNNPCGSGIRMNNDPCYVSLRSQNDPCNVGIRSIHDPCGTSTRTFNNPCIVGIRA